MVDKILEIDKTLTSPINDIRLKAEKIELSVLCEFQLHEEHIKEIPWNTFHYSGIYLFEIKNNLKSNNFNLWIQDFRNIWMDPKYVKCFTPNLTRKRVNEHKNKSIEWIPIYIGKSHRIEGRVHEHIFRKLQSTTYGLKLNSRKNLYEEVFRLQTVEIDLENYDSLMPLIESSLRDVIHPILGRQ